MAQWIPERRLCLIAILSRGQKLSFEAVDVVGNGRESMARLDGMTSGRSSYEYQPSSLGVAFIKLVMPTAIA